MKKGRELLDKFYDLSFGIYFDHLKDLGWAKVYTSDLILDEFNNFADVSDLKENTSEKIDTAENTLRKQSRKPAIYVSEFSNPKNIGDILVKNYDYKKSFEDAWMVLNDSYQIPDSLDTDKIVPVGSSSNLLGALSNILTLSYSGEKSSDNPYGGWPMKGFIDATMKGLTDKKYSEKIEAYLVKDGGEYVACGILLHDSEVGYVCGIGSIPKVRGKGFGKLISNYCSKKSIDLGCTTTFLGTEKGSWNEEFYRRIGYETKFNGICYIKGN